MKDLINYNFYGYITEEMEVSEDFKNNIFQEYKEIRSVALEVSVDPENDIEYRVFLILSFTNRSGYEELIFYFSLLDKNNQFVKGKETIYDKNIANQYLPKELKSSIAFFNKLKEMFKKLIIMEKPLRFFIETYENYTDEKQLVAHRPIIQLILQNGYMIRNEGLSHDKKKYFWEFIQATEQQLKESKEDGFDISKIKKDESYYQSIKENTTEIIRRIVENESKTKKII